MSAAQTESPPDPDTGKFVIWIAGGIGIAAIVAYGTYQLQRKADAQPTAPAAAAAVGHATPAVSPESLTLNVVGARQSLDVTALSKLEQELARAEGRAASTEDGRALKLARAEAISTRALEAAIRAKTVAGDALAAQAVADRAVVDGRSLVDGLGGGVDPARERATRARLALAAGEDITSSHPVVLLPNFHDQDLRLAALSRGLWIGDDLEESELAELVTELERNPQPTGLSRSLVALAKQQQGDSDGALAAADAVLAEVPRQPLALGVRTQLTTVAVADPAAPEIAADPVPEPAGVVEPEPTAVPEPEPEPVADPEPVAAPEPEPVAAPEPEPVAEPAPTPAPEAKADPAAKPKPERATKPKPPRAKGEPKPDRPAKKGFDDLLAEGCKAAKSGDAAAGFKLLKKAHDLSPGGAKVTLCMAQAQNRLGRTSSARAFVDRVLKGSPRNKTALLLAAKLEAKSGNTAAAVKLYRRVLGVDAENKTALAYIEKNG